mmetsp:Transcript_98328/g.225768  ORF Transcript_98328/g.225768 Transcript_98328/m.225768 type:complete len:90 (-) Transcript_98328:86-355(-)
MCRSPVRADLLLRLVVARVLFCRSAARARKVRRCKGRKLDSSGQVGRFARLAWSMAGRECQDFRQGGVVRHRCRTHPMSAVAGLALAVG